MRHNYSDEGFANKAAKYNDEASIELLPVWCRNIADNMDLCIKAKDLAQAPTAENKKAILIGAGWSAAHITGDEYEEMRKSDVDLIVCNKMWRTVRVKYGTVPEWTVLLDANSISATQFEGMEPTEGNFFVASCAYPRTMRIISENVGKEQFYVFNPLTDLQGQIPLSAVWQWMNFKAVFRHGGNVGGTMMQLAMYLQYDQIGLLGFDYCVIPKKEWTKDEAWSHEHIYYPDLDKEGKYPFVSMPFNFMCYSQDMLKEAVKYQAIPGKAVYNLSDTPLLRHSPAVKQGDVHEFCKL